MTKCINYDFTTEPGAQANACDAKWCADGILDGDNIPYHNFALLRDSVAEDNLVKLIHYGNKRKSIIPF